MDYEKAPSGWSLIRMEEACELRKEAINPVEHSSMRYVGLEHIDPGNPELKRNGNSSEVNSSKSRFYPGDILYGKLRPYLDKSALVDFEGLCSTDILVLKSKESTIPQFLVNLIHTNQFLNYAISTSTGVNHPRTSWSSISAFQFLLPPLPEQRAIALALRAVQGAREARLREVALERERKAALMKHLFTHGTRGEATKMTEIGEMPESWKTGKIGDFIKFKSGESRPDNIVSKPALDKTVPVYGGNGIMGYTNKIFSENRHLIIGRVGEYCGCIHFAEPPNWITDNALYSKKWLGDRLLFHFAASYLNYLNLNQFKRKAGQPLITQGVLNEIEIFLPPVEEQNMIASISRSCDSKIAALDQEARLLEELFRAMLEELMSGRLPAGALVRAESGG